MRQVPIFPELRSYLEEGFELAPEDAAYVIDRYRDGNQNLRTQLNRIIRRAGLEPWPKLFHNLRASRETELAGAYPIHVVCSWIGHTAAIAQEHYLQVTEDHFALAAKNNSAPDSARTAQNAAQHPSAPTAHGGRQSEKTPEKSGVFCEIAGESEVDDYPQGDSNPCLSRERAMS